MNSHHHSPGKSGRCIFCGQQVGSPDTASTYHRSKNIRSLTKAQEVWKAKDDAEAKLYPSPVQIRKNDEVDLRVRKGDKLDDVSRRVRKLLLKKERLRIEIAEDAILNKDEVKVYASVLAAKVPARLGIVLMQRNMIVLIRLREKKPEE